MDLRGGGAGPGDLRLWAGRRLGPGSLRLLLSLPTGDERQLRGAGGPGGALWYAVSGRSGRLEGRAALGVARLWPDDPLAPARRRSLPFAGIGGDLHLGERVALTAAIHAHGRGFTGSRIDALHRRGVQLGLGGRLRFGARELTVMFQEDLRSASSADFSLHFGWHLAD